MNRHVTFAMVVAACLANGNSQCIADFVFNANNRPTQITGLTIDSQQYDVTIDWGATFNSVWTSPTSPSPTPTFWGSQSDADEAATAIQGALNAHGVFPTPSGDTVIYIPHTWNGTHVQNSVTFFNSSTGPANYRTSFFSIFPNSVGSNFGAATFTAVPEPSQLLTLGALGIALMVVKSRNRTQVGRSCSESNERA